MDKWDIDITPQTIEDYAKKHGSRSCARIMSVLGKKRPFYDAIRTEIGQELLKDNIIRLEELLDKQIEKPDEMTNDDRVEYKVLKRLTETWAGRIKSYVGKIDKLKERG